jgi:hypothetical protein
MERKSIGRKVLKIRGTSLEGGGTNSLGARKCMGWLRHRWVGRSMGELDGGMTHDRANAGKAE